MQPLLHFYTPWKRQKSKGFLTFLGGIEMEHDRRALESNDVNGNVDTKLVNIKLFFGGNKWKKLEEKNFKKHEIMIICDLSG